MAEAQIVLSNEQKITSKLLENLESSQKCVICKREKYESILNKVKTGEKKKGHSSRRNGGYVKHLATVSLK